MPIFLDVLPRLGLREAEAVVSQAKSLFAGAGKDIGASFGEGPAAAMKRMQEEYGRTANTVVETSRTMVSANSQVELSQKSLSDATAAYGAKAAEAATAERALVDARVQSTIATKAHKDAMAEAVTAQSAMTASTTAHSGAVAATAGVLNKVGIASVVGFTAAMLESTKKAADFEQSQTRLVASAGESATNLKIVSDGILQMAGQVGYSAGELSKGMYTVEKAGFRGADAVTVMTAAAQGAKSEQADLTDVNNGLTTSMNDFHIPATNAADVMSKMVAATAAAKTDFQQFSSSLHSVEPAAAAAHIKLEDVYAVLARMTQSGMSADQATENMRNAINSLSAPTSVMRDNMAKFGISADDVSQHLGERGLSGSLQLISDQIRSRMSPAQQAVVSDMYANAQATKDATQMIKDMSPAAAKLATDLQNGAITHQQFAKATRGSTQDDYAKLQAFGVLDNKLVGYSSNLKKGQDTVETYNRALKDATGTVAAQSVALQTTGENAKSTNDLVAQLTGTIREHDGTVKGFNETAGTLSFKLAQAKDAFGAAAIQLGNVFIPVLTDVTGALSNVAQFLAEHKRIAETVTFAVGGMAAAWAAVKVAMAIGNTFSAITTGLGLIITKVGATSAAYDVLGASATAAATAEEAAAARGVAAAGRLALGAATMVGTLAYLSTQASDWFNHWSDSHPEVQRRDAQNNLIPGRESQGYLHRTGGLPTPGPGQYTPPGSQAEHRGSIMPPGAPPPIVPSTDPQANADEVNRRLAASGVGPLAPPRTPSTTPSAGNPKAPAGTRGDPVYTSSANPTPTSQTGSGVNSLFAPLAQDFGISGGLPGVVSWLTTLLGNMAIASIAGPLGATAGSLPGFGSSSTLGANASAPVYVSDVNAQTGYSTNQLRDMLAANKVAETQQKAQAAADKYGPDSPQAQRANLAVTRAQESQQNLETQQSIPSSSRAAAQGSSGAVAAGPGAEGWRNTVAQTVDKYGAQMGVTSANRQKWIDSIVSQIGTESGGNPGADNSHDPNGQGGIQHVAGLLQYLPSSYANSGGKLTGLPYMDPVGQIAGALFAPRNADGSPATGAPGGIGAGHGWGPVSTPIQSVAPTPSGPTAGDTAKANAASPLTDYFGGGGEGPIFKRSPGASTEQYGPRAPGAGLIWSPRTGWQPSGFGVPLGTDPKVGTTGGPLTVGSPPSSHSTVAPGAIGPFGVPPGVAAAAPPSALGPPPLQPPGGPPSSGMDSLAPTAVPGAGSGAGVGLSGPASLAPTAPPSGGGGGADGGGLIGAAAGMMPGGQVAAALATRAVKFGAQAAGILVGGALETFLPHDSPLADPGKSWFGKIAAGFSGARPATPNAAGQTPPPQNAQQQQQGQQQHKGTGAPPGPTNGVYIENMNNHGADGQGVASDIARAQYAQYQAGGPR